MRKRSGRYGFLAASGLLLGPACGPDSIQEMEPRTFGEPKLATQLSDKAINESSGLARSHRYPGTYYTHNDSGDTARFWRFDLNGKVWGPYRVAGAEALDWEDMASARSEGKPYLYFGDIGDNAEKRESIQVYRVEEPDEDAAEVNGTKFTLEYPDGPHNAEALMVAPKTGNFWIVTKTSKGPSKIFEFAAPREGSVNRGVLRGELSLGGPSDISKLVTGGDISEHGRFLVLRTYTAAYEFPFDFFTDWWKTRSRSIKTAAELQGEAIAYSLDGGSLVTTSEFSPCPVSVIPLNRKHPTR